VNLADSEAERANSKESTGDSPGIKWGNGAATTRVTVQKRFFYKKGFFPIWLKDQ
jgi:hypothetical protein